MIASGAWNQEFSHPLSHRPFYTVAYREEDNWEHVCSACHRRSKIQGSGMIDIIYMYGCEYDAVHDLMM